MSKHGVKELLHLKNYHIQQYQNKIAVQGHFLCKFFCKAIWLWKKKLDSVRYETHRFTAESWLEVFETRKVTMFFELEGLGLSKIQTMFQQSPTNHIQAHSRLPFKNHPQKPGNSLWPFWDGEFTWPFSMVVGDLQRSGMKRSRLESPGTRVSKNRGTPKWMVYNGKP